MSFFCPVLTELKLLYPALQLRYGFRFFDDSYITLRFAANLYKYGGITYDGSSYFIGATSPLHIMCVALLGLFLKMEAASLAVGIVFFILSCLMLYLWSLRLYDKQTALLAGLMMAICYWLVADALNGLETTSFIFFSLLTFYLFSSHPSRPFYILPLVFSILTRPEGWFMACALFAWQLFQCCVQQVKKILRHLSIAIGRGSSPGSGKKMIYVGLTSRVSLTMRISNVRVTNILSTLL